MAFDASAVKSCLTPGICTGLLARMITPFPSRILVGTILATALCTSAALAAKNQTAKLTLADNKVTVAGQPKPIGSTIAPGETIVTGSRSRAEVTLPDGTVARIGQGSSFSFDGSKLTLNQGSALFNLTGKNTKIVTPALVRTGGAGVVSVHASPSYNALFDLKGTDTVNGTPLVAGQAWVRESGGPRTFTYDMQKMVGSSTLVTKFPQTPWVAQTAALASVQHQLIAAAQRGTNPGTASGSTTVAVANSGKPPGFLGRLASAFSGNSSPVGGAQSVAGGTLAVNGNGARNTGATLDLGTRPAFATGSAITMTADFTQNLTVANAARTISAGTLSIGNGNFATLSGTAQNAVNAGGTLVFNAHPNAGAVNLAGLVKAGAGTLALNGNSSINAISGTVTIGTSAGAQTGNVVVTGLVTTTIAQTIGAGTLNGGAVTVNSGNLVLTNGNVPAMINLPSGSTGTINGVNLSILQPGQTVTLNGTTFTVGAGTGASGGLLLTPATPAAH